MKFGFITPIRFISSFGVEGDFIFALSHLIDLEEENEYEKVIKKTRMPIMLDNGLFENKIPEGLSSLIDKAIRINAFAFWSPDYLFDAEKTKKQIDATYDVMVTKGLVEGYRFATTNKTKLGAVVQAKNREEWLQQYEDFTHDERIDLIGLSILSIPHAYKMPITAARIACMKDLLQLSVKHKRNHLLGLGSSMQDVIFARQNCPWIQSNDSCCVFQSGLYGKKLTDKLEVPGDKVKEKLDFNLKQITSKQRKDILYNINKVKKLCK